MVVYFQEFSEEELCKLRNDGSLYDGKLLKRSCMCVCNEMVRARKLMATTQWRIQEFNFGCSKKNSSQNRHLFLFQPSLQFFLLFLLLMKSIKLDQDSDSLNSYQRMQFHIGTLYGIHLRLRIEIVGSWNKTETCPASTILTAALAPLIPTG